MIGTLYRYPHPQDPTRFIYVGQVGDVKNLQRRERKHRSGNTSFGRRFKKMFFDLDLPRPVYEYVEVENCFDLNDLETVWMFRYHTWCGYPEGMNLTFPGSADYTKVGSMGSREDKVRAGRIAGRIAVDSGQLASIAASGGRLGGSFGGHLGGPITCCLRWNIRRGKPCTCGKHLGEVK